MGPKIHLVNQAVQRIRYTFKSVMEDGRTFIRGDPDAVHYQECLDVTDLKEDPRFPRVSASKSYSMV